MMDNLRIYVNPKPRLPAVHGRQQSTGQLIVGMVVIGIIAACVFGGIYWAIWH